MKDMSEYALEVSLKISRFSGKRSDASLSGVVAGATQGSEHAFRVVKDVIPHRFLKPINSAITKVRKVFDKYTMPWLHDGTGVVPVSLYMRMMEEFDEARRGVTRAVIALIDDMPAIRNAARIESGSAFDPSLIPTDEQIRDMFSVKLSVSPLKTRGDFRVQMSEDVISSIKEDFEREISEQMAESTYSIITRIAQVVENMANGLERHGMKEDGSKRMSTFKVNTIDNVRELAAIIDDLNVSGIKDITEIASDIRTKLAVHDVTSLKDNDNLRASVAEDARAILRKTDKAKDSVRDFFGV